MENKKEATNNKAVIYARTASNAQLSTSVSTQIEDCMQYAEKQGLTVIGKYVDIAESGKTADRPEFMRMLEDVKAGMFCGIIVDSPDRFSENRLKYVIYKNQLKESGVSCLSAIEDEDNKIVEVLYESFLEVHSFILSERINYASNKNLSEKSLEYSKRLHERITKEYSKRLHEGSTKRQR